MGRAVRGVTGEGPVGDPDVVETLTGGSPTHGAEKPEGRLETSGGPIWGVLNAAPDSD